MCVTWGRLLSLPEFSFLICETGKSEPTSEDCRRRETERNKAHEPCWACRQPCDLGNVSGHHRSTDSQMGIEARLKRFT